MKTKKTKQTAKINWGWDAPENRKGKATRVTKSEQKLITKSLGFKGILIAFLILVICAGISFGSCYFITRNDCFELYGNDELTLTVGEKYVEDGYKVIEFNKNRTDRVFIETDMKINSDGSYSPIVDESGEFVVGTYYIIYKTDTLKYSKISSVERIRLITFVEASEDSE